MTNNWMIQIKRFLCIHDWETIDVSFCDSHLKCKKCYKQKIVPHDKKEWKG
jgi:hypothetical protein